MSRASQKISVLAVLFALWLAACGTSDPYQGMDADALFRLAQAEFEEEDYDNAVDALDRLTASFGDWPRIAEARLLLATAHYEDGDYLTARAEYQRFLNRFVGHALSSEAAIGECRALAALAPHPQRDQTYTREAITICGNVVVDYQGTPEAAEAREIREELRHTMAEKEFLNADHYFRREQYDPAILYYQFVVDDYPDTEFAPQALLRIYEANKEIGYDDLADEAMRQLLIEYPESDAAEEIRTGTSGEGS